MLVLPAIARAAYHIARANTEHLQKQHGWNSSQGTLLFSNLTLMNSCYFFCVHSTSSYSFFFFFQFSADSFHFVYIVIISIEWMPLVSQHELYNTIWKVALKALMHSRPAWSRFGYVKLRGPAMNTLETWDIFRHRSSKFINKRIGNEAYIWSRSLRIRRRQRDNISCCKLLQVLLRNTPDTLKWQ